MLRVRIGERLDEEAEKLQKLLAGLQVGDGEILHLAHFC